MSYKVRLAQDGDIPQIFEMGLEFAKKSQPVHKMVPCEEKIKWLISEGIRKQDQVWLVLSNDVRLIGFIFGVINEPYFSETLVMQEMAFYVRPTLGLHSLRLLIAFEKVSKAKGVEAILCGSKPKFCDLKRFYEYRGYDHMEDQFLKML
jgi:hypothetical protein